MKNFKHFLGIFILLLSQIAFASFDQAPPSFAHKDGKAIFVEFIQSHHELNYDFADKTLKVESTISFETFEEGYPIFDLDAEPNDTVLNDHEVLVEKVADPDNQTSYQVVQEKLPAGKYTLKLNHSITTNVVFDETGVASAFWLSDLTDRKYLEQYLPSNLEFDQYPKTFIVNFENFGDIRHIVKANGKVTKIDESRYEIAYPDFYSSSSVYFHVFPETSPVSNVQFYYPSIDGRLIPVDIYAIVDIEPFVSLTKTLMAELEADYGPFPYDQILIYGRSLVKGGMEYSGATSTGLLSLGHELFHCYNARGIMPANGNAGWMDEAMARWRDNQYPLAKELTFDYTRIGGHSIYRRYTDRMSYTEGSAFLSMIAYKMNEKGLSLKAFLKDYFQKYMYTTVTTQLFEKELTEASGLDLSEDFNRYVYGKYAPAEKMSSHKHVEEDPHHPHMSKEELLRITMPQ